MGNTFPLSSFDQSSLQRHLPRLPVQILFTQEVQSHVKLPPKDLYRAILFQFVFPFSFCEIFSEYFWGTVILGYSQLMSI